MKSFAKYILLAQTASDAGKGYESTKAINGRKAIDGGYCLKPDYIRQAISEAKKYPEKVHVSISDDNGMDVVYFDIPGYGQVSFHCPEGGFEKYNLPDGEWNGISGGSLKTCQKLAKKFNLPWYNHGRRSKRR
jgi:hypothetical protein